MQVVQATKLEKTYQAGAVAVHAVRSMDFAIDVGAFVAFVGPAVIPEVTYTRITNLELRLRLQFNQGDRLTDYGEKAVDARVELRMRYFF